VAKSQQSRSTAPGRSLAFMALVLALTFGGIGLGVAVKDAAAWTPKLGLDLEGGSTITLTPQAAPGAKVTTDNINEAVSIIRQRIDAAGVGESEVAAQGTGSGRTIVVSVPGKQDNSLLQEAARTAQLRIRQVLAEGTSAAATPTAPASGSASSSAGSTASSSAASTARSTAGSTAKPSVSASAKPSASGQGRSLSHALLAAGASTTPSATTPAASTATSTASGAPAASGSATAVATPAPVPTITAAQAAKIIPAAAQQLAAAVAAGQDVSSQLASVPCWPNDQVPFQYDQETQPILLCQGSSVLLLAKADLVGKDVSDASASLETNATGQTTGSWQVNLNFKPSGERKWSALTKRVSAQDLQTKGVNLIAIELDGRPVSVATVTQQLGGDSRITGSFNASDARTLARQIKFGALPLSFESSNVQTISPALGSDQLRGGLVAGTIGLILVVLYSLLYYRGLGFVSVASLLVSALLTYGLVTLLSNQIGYRLSLPGVAGLIVAIGITADSFIVYFERLRDEVREGRSLRVAVESGWVRARRTILTADFVSFLAAAVLYVISIGSVKGFAFTLGLTTLVDVVVVFLFTKPLVTIAARHTFFTGGHAWSGLDPRRLGAKAKSPAAGRTRPNLTKEA
jgi:preprotein translocase subunit SecD